MRSRYGSYALTVLHGIEMWAQKESVVFIVLLSRAYKLNSFYKKDVVDPPSATMPLESREIQ